MRNTVAFTAVGLALLAAVYCAPAFLLVSDAPIKSDAVILFLGGEKGTREKEARQLLKEGWADYLIIPARGQVQKLDPSGKLIRLDLTLTVPAPNEQTNKLTNQQTSPPNQRTNEPTNQRTWVVEDTHEEALIARDMMERMGLRSAILVSAPYHMRRIKLIADRVFNTQSLPPSETVNTSLPLREGQREGEEKEFKNGFSLYCIPTRYEPPNDGFWLFNSYERKFVLTEYAKIAWFALYSQFV